MVYSWDSGLNHESVQFLFKSISHYKSPCIRNLDLFSRVTFSGLLVFPAFPLSSLRVTLTVKTGCSIRALPSVVFPKVKLDYL